MQRKSSNLHEIWCKLVDIDVLFDFNNGCSELREVDAIGITGVDATEVDAPGSMFTIVEIMLDWEWHDTW